ncbi:unnamed protein product [Sphagnum jensenii]|uniref:Tafazzin family protein n=1 Tax=Sphagnum jensenii TaxID=128206 RepID=A0ABP1B947_9BRYO
MRALSMVPDSAKATHLGGIPRRIILTTVGAFAKLYTTVLNSTQVYNKDMLMSLVMSRSPGTPLVTVSNHMSTLDDPLMWGFQGFPISDPKLCRWTLAASDICFTNPFYSYFFRLGKCIPITRGEGIYQPHMSEALNRINEGDWIHTFPEGKVCQEASPLRRLKWGTASLIARAAVSPIVLPIAHSGFEKVLPENYWHGRRPLVPLWMKPISIVVGEPIQFDVPGLKRAAHDWARASAVLEEAAWRWMYTHITEHIWVALQDLVWKAKTLNESRCKEQIH